VCYQCRNRPDTRLLVIHLLGLLSERMYDTVVVRNTSASLAIQFVIALATEYDRSKHMSPVEALDLC